MTIFDKDGDYEAFERVLVETLECRPMRLCSYCLMPNHWHLILWPEDDGDLAAFMQRLTITHARRWQEHRHCVGDGHVYQGRYKSFPIQSDSYFYNVVRYVERNALRANLVSMAEAWRWGSLWRRTQGTTKERQILSRWPLPRPRSWLELVNDPQTDEEVAAIRKSVNRGVPYGSGSWTKSTAARLGLESTLRKRGRPRKNES